MVVIWLKVLILLAATVYCRGRGGVPRSDQKSVPGCHHVRGGSLRCRFWMPGRATTTEFYRRRLCDVLCRGDGRAGRSLLPRGTRQDAVGRLVSPTGEFCGGPGWSRSRYWYWP